MNYLVAFGVTLFFGMLIGVGMTNYKPSHTGFYSYAQQREDRDACEAVIPRNKQCVASMIWLPEAED